MVSKSPKSKLGVFTVGMGAVATTLMAGVELVRSGRRPPVGAYTQLGWIEGRDGQRRRVAEVLPLARLEDLVFGGIDLVETNAGDAARTAAVLSAEDLALVDGFLRGVEAGPGLHDPLYVRTLPRLRVRPEQNKAEQAAAMTAVFRDFFARNSGGRGVVLLTLSTEAWRTPGAVHASIEAFRAGLARNDPDISPSQIYAWAAIEAGFPVVNCTPNPVLEAPAIRDLAAERTVVLAGSDLKSGQTLMKTVIAAGLAKRYLGVKGWFSTNILGNRDGFVLHEPQNFRAKEITKGGVLDDIFDKREQPALYQGMEHQVHINYYPPKGDNKEAWDAIQLFGWLGYDVEIKVNFQCRDSILAAPLVLDLALLADLAAQKGAGGIQSWLGGYFKNPGHRPDEKVSNDLHVQVGVIEDQLKTWL